MERGMRRGGVEAQGRCGAARRRAAARRGGGGRRGAARAGGGGRRLLLERLDELDDAGRVLGHRAPDPIVQVAREERAW